MIKLINCLTLSIFVVTLQSCGKQLTEDEKVIVPQAKIVFLDMEKTESGEMIGRFSFENTARFSYDLRSLMRDSDGSVHCHHPSFLYQEGDEWKEIDITYAGVVSLTRIKAGEKFIIKVSLRGLKRVPQKERYILRVDEIKSMPFKCDMGSVVSDF